MQLHRGAHHAGWSLVARSLVPVASLLILFPAQAIPDSGGPRPGEIGIFLDPQGIEAAGLRPQFSQFTYYVVVRRPQPGMSSCRFRVPSPAGAIVLETRIADGLVDLDPSVDGYELVPADGCFEPSGSIVLVTCLALLIERACWVDLLPADPSSVFPASPTYTPCGEPIALPLRPNPWVCEYQIPGSLMVNNGCLLGAYIFTYAVVTPTTAGLPGDRVTVPLTAFTGTQLDKANCSPPLSIAQIEVSVEWDSTAASLEWVDRAAATQHWQLSHEVLRPGKLRASLDRGQEPPLLATGRDILELGFLLADHSAWTGVNCVVLHAADEHGENCTGGWELGQIFVGCESGDVTADRQVNAGDATVALQMQQGRRALHYTDLCAGDMDGDWALDLRDVHNLLRRAIGAPLNRSDPLDPPLPAPPSNPLSVTLTVREVHAFQATLQFDPQALQFNRAVPASGVLETHLASPGLLRLADALPASGDRSIEVTFAVIGPVSPVRLVGLRGFDADGHERSVPFSFPDGTVAVDPPPSEAQRTRLLPAAPNPFNPRTQIRFMLATGGDAGLRIFDAAGREVQSLRIPGLAPGLHEVGWDGRDGQGQLLGSGVYRVQLLAPGGEASVQSVVLLK